MEPRRKARQSLPNIEDLPSPPFKCRRPSLPRSSLRSHSTSSFHDLRRPATSSNHKRRLSFQDFSPCDAKTSVINLPWTDMRGSQATYTGEVSELIQPHGFGFLVYKDGSVLSSTWCNGMPLRESVKQDVYHHSNSTRRILDLGDIAYRQDEMQRPSLECAFEPHVFPVHSFAFVRRSDGSWTYAIVADRPCCDSIRFVVDKRGSTKIIKRKYWSRYVRLVRDEDDDMSCDGTNEQDYGNRDYCYGRSSSVSLLHNASFRTREISPR